MRVKRFIEWAKEHEQARERLERLAAGFPRPYRRLRPRAADEAQLLRERGTPERLIGPEDPRPDFPPLEEDPLWDLVGISDAEPVDDIDEFLYGPKAKP
jgi:hypothetical protein